MSVLQVQLSQSTNHSHSLPQKIRNGPLPCFCKFCVKCFIQFASYTRNLLLPFRRTTKFSFLKEHKKKPTNTPNWTVFKIYFFKKKKKFLFSRTSISNLQSTKTHQSYLHFCVLPHSTKHSREWEFAQPVFKSLSLFRFQPAASPWVCRANPSLSASQQTATLGL